MAMQATRLPHTEVTSGTYEADKPRDLLPDFAPDAIAEAHRLAREIEQLLTQGADEAGPYGMRLARALAQSLIDQLADLSRDSKRTKVA